MTMEKYFINMERVADDQPLKETAFFQWLKFNRPDNFTDAMVYYLYPKGFIFRRDFISPEQFKLHSIIFDHFLWCYHNNNL